ncbi:MAG TPA: hypothetical protein ENN23_03890 [Deltaproteobacteria bacterium]|nr:hypothetical protein [Deltaproteobacteria bacterium]
MARIIKYMAIVAVFSCLLIYIGCASYERQVAPFQMPESSPNAVNVDGAIIAARAFTDARDAKEAFGFDIRAGGILPVQVVFDNRSEHNLIIVAEQTFLIDDDSNVWPILDQELAYDRISKSTELGRVMPEAAKGALLLGAAGAVVGAAIGIVTGTNVGEAMGKGAAVGAAAGAVTGGAHGMGEHYADVQKKIKKDLQHRSLQYRAVKPNELAYGYILYPGEAKSAKVLRLQIKARDTGKVSTFNMKLK